MWLRLAADCRELAERVPQRKLKVHVLSMASALGDLAIEPERLLLAPAFAEAT